MGGVINKYKWIHKCAESEVKKSKKEKDYRKKRNEEKKLYWLCRIIREKESKSCFSAQMAAARLICKTRCKSEV